jgi:hypothetical protein
MFTRKILPPVSAALACVALAALAQMPTPLAPGVTIVLPPRVVANAQASVAVLGLDGHLVPNITAQISAAPVAITGRPGAQPAAQLAPQYVTTDATGRAAFTAPPSGAVIVQAAGASAAALVDPSLPPPNATVAIAPAVSLRDRFSLCGAGFSGNAADDRATANGDAMFVLAASPECLVVLAQSRTLYGPAKIEVDSGAGHVSTATSLVALDFSPPDPPLMPGKESALIVRADGTSAPLRLVIENRSPGVLTFVGGDMQQGRTTGGNPNQAQVKAKAIRSGDFSFDARLLPAPDPASAARYLGLAAAAAAKNQRGKLNKLSSQLAHNPKDTARAARDLDRIAVAIPPGPLRTLLDAARTCLQ